MLSFPDYPIYVDYVSCLQRNRKAPKPLWTPERDHEEYQTEQITESIKRLAKEHEVKFFYPTQAKQTP